MVHMPDNVDRSTTIPFRCGAAGDGECTPEQVKGSIIETTIGPQRVDCVVAKEELHQKDLEIARLTGILLSVESQNRDMLAEVRRIEGILDIKFPQDMWKTLYWMRNNVMVVADINAPGGFRIQFKTKIAVNR
jgi:hypothetical protein